VQADADDCPAAAVVEPAAHGTHAETAPPGLQLPAAHCVATPPAHALPGGHDAGVVEPDAQ